MAKWSGDKDAGAREYTEGQRTRAVRWLKEKMQGRKAALPWEVAAKMIGISNRTLRAIVSDCDGIEFIIGEDGKGAYFLADFADETEHQTRVLFAAARSTKQRAERRAEYAQGMPRQQGMLV